MATEADERRVRNRLLLAEFPEADGHRRWRVDLPGRFGGIEVYHTAVQTPAVDDTPIRADPLHSYQRSRRVMERLGMPYRGESFAHSSVPADPPLRLPVLYRRRREPWRPRGEGT